MPKTIHVSLDIEGALANWPRRQFKGMLRDENGLLLSPDEARRELLRLLGSGVKFIPVGKCDNFDTNVGCLGHSAENTGSAI